jgi:large subunit ribosomal protein L6
MSKIADRTLLIPEGVSVSYEPLSRILTVKGNNNSLLTQDIHNQVDLIIEDNSIKTKFIPQTEEKNEAILGTMNSLVNNMLIGAKEGYQKVLDIKGVGYKVSLNNSVLDFSLGYSHNILLKIPSELSVDCINSTKLIIKGASKQQVG